MTSLIKAELYKLKTNYLLIGIILGIAIISIFLSQGAFSNIPLQITNETPSFFSGEDISRGEHVFKAVMRDSSFASWLSVIFAGIFIGVGFWRREINRLLFSGKTKSQIFIVKILEFYIFACVITAIYPIVSCLQFSTEWFLALTTMEFQYVIRCILIRILLDMGTLSFSLIPVFIFRDPIRPIGVFLVFTIIISQVSGIRHNLGSGTFMHTLLSSYPPVQYKEIMNTVITNEQISLAIISSTIIIVVSLATSYFFFVRTEFE